MNNKLSLILKATISLGLMAYLFYYFLADAEQRAILFELLTTVNLGYMLLALMLFMIAVITNAIKWQILLRAQGIPVPLTALTNYTFVGFFFNNFLPANVGGDVMRGFGLARYTAQGADAAVSVIVDRIIGLLAFMFTAVIAAIAAINFIAFDETTAEGQLLAENLAVVETTAIVGTVILLAAFAILLSHRLRQWVGELFKLPFLTPLAPIYQPISDAFGAYRHQYTQLLLAFGVGVITVLLTGCVDIAIVAGLPGSIPAIYIFLLNPIIAVALIAPISIGGLGTGSWLYVYFYGLVGVPEALAFALSLIKQGVVYLGSLPGGFLWLRADRKKTASTSDSPQPMEVSSS